ncbi:aspartate aminotransferase family protein [Nitrosospira multiformis]|uniref:Diaminobutyrate--2-oxoglutarate transaminase n=1 Tax=Nitrosospira multiformis TaxID=1231 RepID=A0A1I7F1R2_9PROT|nr:aspartate aminotransferase family protein [Nitrosospira multiformis]SFU30096.1 ornithine--oxo-acid transaminase [Nitrosospira multiformis]
MPIDINAIIAETRGKNFELYEEHINPVFVKVLRTLGFNRTWVRGEGAYLWDETGTRYLDFLTNWGVFNFGRRHPAIRNALQQVMDAEFPGWVGFDAPPLAAVLARELVKRMPPGLDTVYFSNSGTEAIEAAIKFARGYTGRPSTAHLAKAFHGLTMGSLSLNGEASFRRGFEPMLPGSSEVKMGDLAGLEARLAKGDVAAFVFEPIQGKGVNIASDEYLLGAQELCRKYGTLMVCDEIQCGMGRTGRFLASQWVPDFRPDIVCLSKALSGGYIPVGATITRRTVYDSVYDSLHRAIVHASTFGMGNMAMVAALASLNVLDDEKLMDRAMVLGERFRKGIEAMVPRFEFLKGVRQRGLMIAIEFGQPESMSLRAAWAMVNKMDENLFAQAIVLPLLDDHHILTQVAGHAMPIVKILPPLNIGESDVDWFLAALEDVMIKLHKFPGPAWEVLKKLGNHALTAKKREARVTA